MGHLCTMYMYYLPAAREFWETHFLDSGFEEEVQFSGPLDLLILIHWMSFFGNTYKVSVLSIFATLIPSGYILH